MLAFNTFKQLQSNVSLRRAELLQKAFIIVLFLSCLPIWALDETVIEAILPVGSPQIKEERITFSVDIQFKKVPLTYWVFHDQGGRKLILQFFNTRLNAGTLNVHGVDILSEPVVSNAETDWTLTGKSSQLSFIFKDGWHCESLIVSKTILRLQLWKYLETSPKRMNKPRNLGIIVIGSLLSAGSAVLAFLVLSKINK